MKEPVPCRSLPDESPTYLLEEMSCGLTSPRPEAGSGARLFFFYPLSFPLIGRVRIAFLGSDQAFNQKLFELLTFFDSFGFEL